MVRMNGQTRTVHGPVGRGTNNEAEYQGLIVGLRAALDVGARSVVVRGDSQLAIRQLEGRYAVKAANLRPLFEEAKALMGRFERVQLEWVKRADNADADAAANAALDA